MKAKTQQGDPHPTEPGFRVVVFDMDGVVTRTADLHAAAWKELFDAYLRERERRGEPGFRPFDLEGDYLAQVDGKPRYEGVRAFLASRGLTLPAGDPADGEGEETVYGLGRRKDALFEERLRAQGARAYGATVALIEALRARGVPTALITSSRHGREVLEAAGVIGLFDVILDGVDAANLGLKGKPDADVFLEAAKRLGAEPGQGIVVEDAVAGVEAGRRGGFGLVVGVDRGGNSEALASRGADVVVADLGELTVETLAARFRERAKARAPEAAPALAARAWQVEQEGFDPAREHGMESLFTVGNGYLGVRGTLDMPLPGSQADLFIAGIYDRKQSSLPYSELEFLTGDRSDYAYSEIVSAPFPFGLEIIVDGQRLDLAQGPWRVHRRVLDLARGALQSHYLYEDDRGRRTRVEAWRCASSADPHLLLQEVSVTCENHESLVQLDTSIHEASLALDHPHLEPVQVDAPAGLDLRAYKTRASGYTVALASRAGLGGEQQDRVIWQAGGKAGVTVRLRRYLSVYTSRDGTEPVRAAAAHVLGKRFEDFERERAAHEARWEVFWAAADIECKASPATTQALRFNVYHLRIAADHDPRVSVGARSLSGRAYEGHVFWDVEVFMLPFYLHTDPDIARHLLLYRHRTLDGARERARSLGYRGACYAWESTVTGADTTPRRIVLKTTGKEIPIYTGYEQVHVTADVAYGVWRYWQATRDDAFLRGPGAEILLETARFWASRCIRGPRHYHIRAVTGPDEYHHTVNDNAYTNWMAHFNLEKAIWVGRSLALEHPERWEALAASLALAPEEIGAWEEIARELYIPAPNDAGVIEQFEGYFDRREYRPAEAERFRPPLERLFNAEEINASQLIKQADVLMVPFLFPEAFSREVLAANYRYYEPRTDHGSSLSPSVHAALAARLGLVDDARRYWRESLWLDLSNTMGNSALGVHAACMGGTWQALVFGFLGVRFTEDGPVVDGEAPRRLLEEWGEVALTLAYRGHRYPVRVAPAEEGR
ncbi:beta-phosphoglucomutase [Sulfurifustis variabilis]|uniref:Beta-phosphoglucomutase n=1 Tax=Sulfurifustis variabilis TaxID=1675686 RepID=A0A1B4VG14_9GAMM|nr:HAD-IA family hydrolase [Sulfurifustis variabilis]BAU49717.1 beta-phosphoglucomutase [Sulfurifustis variabilis]